LITKISIFFMSTFRVIAQQVFHFIVDQCSLINVHFLQ
jgi:hypothetical protein